MEILSILAPWIVLGIFFLLLQLDMRYFRRALATGASRHTSKLVAPKNFSGRDAIVFQEQKVAAMTEDLKFYDSHECKVMGCPLGSLYIALRSKLSGHNWPAEPPPWMKP